MRIRVAALAALLTQAAQAHHSFAMFDQQNTVTLQGTVKEFQWTNPHCFIQLVVADEGELAEWSLEMHSPAASLRHGWKRNSLAPGDVVTVVINPLRDGSPGGFVVLARDADGTPLHTVAGQR